MLHLQEAIRKKLSEVLNDNEKGVDFDVSLYNFDKPPNFYNKKLAESSYNVEKIKYIPTLIEEMAGELESTRGVNMTEPTLFVSFFVPTAQSAGNLGGVVAQDNTEDFGKAIDEVRMKYQGRPIHVGDTGWYIKKGAKATLKNDGATIDRMKVKFKAYQDGVIFDGGDDFKVEVSSGHIIAGDVLYDPDYKYGTAVEVELDIGDDAEGGDHFEFYNFDGVIYYFGVDEDETSDGFSALIEDFNAFNNEGVSDEWETTVEHNWGATPLGEHGDITITFAFPNPTTNQFTFGDDAFQAQIFDVGYDLTYTKDLFLGNHYNYYIDGNQIYPFSRSEGYTGTPDIDQYIEGYTSKGYISDNILGKTYTVYQDIDKPLNDLFYNYIHNEPDQNKIWTLKIEYPTHNEEYQVMIKEIGVQGSDNSPSILTIQIELADD